jgi:hypothetical protein
MISTQLDRFDTIFIDTAPIIYFLEAHSIYGDISKIIVDYFQNEKLIAYSSVLTITEVLPKPISVNKIKLAEKYIMFLKNGRNSGSFLGIFGYGILEAIFFLMMVLILR